MDANYSIGSQQTVFHSHTPRLDAAFVSSLPRKPKRAITHLLIAKLQWRYCLDNKNKLFYPYLSDASNLTDRISELPHDILGGTILSLLPLKEAAATSILSKRWRYEWCFTTNLYFDSDDTLNDFRALKREFKNKKSCRYVNWVDHVLKQHRGSSIEQFRVCFDLDRRFASSIDKWVQFAMKKRVRVFVLDFLLLYGVMYEDSYAFPCTLLGLDEKEKGSSLMPFRCRYGGFEFLRVLHLEHVDVTREVVEYFMSNCPTLE
ncbi:unnamed protein product [Prunus brigantina]